MDSIWLEYAWTLCVLIGLEGILSADNALVIAVFAKHLPHEEEKRAINYGIICTLIFHLATIFAFSHLSDIYQFPAIGARYLIFLWVRHIYTTDVSTEADLTDKTKK